MSKKRKILIILLVVVSLPLLSVAILYNSDFFMFRVMLGLNSVHPQLKAKVDFEKQRDKVIHLVEDINPVQLLDKGRKSKLRTLSFELSPDDMQYFEQAAHTAVRQNYLLPECREWRKVDMTDLSDSDKKYAVKMKLRGGSPNHWERWKRSFNIKVRNGKTFNGIDQFSLTLPDDRWLNAALVLNWNKMLGIIDIRWDFVRVYINGVDHGVYYLQEKLNNNLLENNAMTSSIMIDQEIRSERRELNVAPVAGYQVDDDVVYKEQILFLTRSFVRAAETGDRQYIWSMLDRDSTVKVEAMRALIHDWHMVVGGNLRLRYDQSLGRFYIVPRGEAGVCNVNPINGSFDQSLNLVPRQMPLFVLLSKDPYFRLDRNRLLYKMLMDGNKWAGVHKSIMETYWDDLTTDFTNRATAREFKYTLKLNQQKLEENFKTLTSCLKRSACDQIIEIRPDTIKIELSPLTYSAMGVESMVLELSNYKEITRVRFTDLSSGQVAEEEPILSGTKLDLSKFFENKILYTELNDSLAPVPTRHEFSIQFQGLRNIDTLTMVTQLKNLVTDEYVPEEAIRSTVVRRSDAPNRVAKIEEYLAKSSLPWMLNGLDLILRKGNYEVLSNEIIPGGVQVKIEAGTTIKLASGISIISFSPWHARGTDIDPVKITSLSPDKPYGVIGISPPEHTLSTFSWMHVSHGSETFMNGIFYSGGFCVYGGKAIIMENCIFSDHVNDDGLNIKHADVLLTDCKFINNGYDQVDLDFCRGIVANSTFSVEVPNPDGDGLDVSGANMIIQECIFTGLGDKGISVGERSRVSLVGNTIESCEIGVAAKDESLVYLEQSSLGRNGVDLSAYRKKKTYTGSKVILGPVSNMTTKTDDLSLIKKSTERLSQAPFPILSDANLADTVEKVLLDLEAVSNFRFEVPDN